MTAELLALHLPALLIGVPLFFAFTLLLVAKLGDSAREWWVLFGTTLTAAIGLSLAYHVFTEGAVTYVFGAASATDAIPEGSKVPIRIIFMIDAMGAMMVSIASVVGWTTTLFSLKSEEKTSGQTSYYALLLLLLTGVLGLVTTGDLFNFFVFLEISSLAGAALAAYRVDRGVAAEAGLKYGLLSTLAGLLVLIAVGLLYAQYNSLNIAQLSQRLQQSNLDKVALVLFLAPLAMKCGAVPMHFWTPDTYSAAPPAVTSMLVVTSQGSLYGLFRILFSLYGVSFDMKTLGWVVIILGVLSMFVGVTMAIPQKDVKRLMAYHAVSQTGYMLLGVGVGIAVLGDPVLLEKYGKTAMVGGLFHIGNHAIYKGLLFLTAGAVFYRTGTRNLNQLGGLGHSMKWTMVFFIFGALAIAGIPPFNGFASKLVIYESVYAFNPILAVIAMVVSILTLASFVKVFHSIFMGPRLSKFAEVREAPASMLIGMGILAFATVVLGLFPQTAIDWMITPAVDALIGQKDYVAAVLGGG